MERNITLKDTFQVIVIEGKNYTVDINDFDSVDVLTRFKEKYDGPTPTDEMLDDCKKVIDTILGNGTYQSIFGQTKTMKAYLLVNELANIYLELFMKEEREAQEAKQKEEIEKFIQLMNGFNNFTQTLKYAENKYGMKQYVSGKPTKSIRIGDIDYPIRVDFRTWIKVESILKDSDIPNQFKLSMIITLCDLFYGDVDIVSEETDAIYDGIFSFWRMFKPMNPKARRSNDIAYRYDVDFDLIAAAFMQQYNINLFTQDLHWFVFKSLFDGLSENTMFRKIVGYRTVDLSKVPKEQKKEYSELKEFYRIKDESVHRKTPQEIEKELLAKVGG